MLSNITSNIIMLGNIMLNITMSSITLNITINITINDTHYHEALECGNKSKSLVVQPFVLD